MKRKRRVSEYSSDEELPVKKLKPQASTSSKMKKLMKTKREKCEFCDRVFYNRYDILVHNTEHIVIPLTRDPLPQCPACNLYFATKDDLTVHTELRHNVPDIFKKLFNDSNVHYNHITENSQSITETDTKKKSKDFVDKELVVKCDNSLRDLMYKINEEKLGNIVNKKAVVKCDDSVTELIMESNEKKLEKIVNKKAIVACDNTLTKLIIGSKTADTMEDTAIKDSEKKLENLVNKQAIVKCDDIVTELIMERNEKKLEKIVKKDAIVACDNTLTKLIIGSKVCKDLDKQDDYDDDICIISDDEDNPVDNDKTKTGNNISNRILFENDFEDDIIQFNNPTTVIEINTAGSNCVDDCGDEYIIPDKVPLLVEQVSWSPSVHYEELIEPEEHKCKMCRMVFPNRYKLIIHEVAHIKMRTRPPKGSLLCLECERYIPGNYHNLRHHMAEKHPNATLRRKNLKCCEKCGLKYNDLVRHHFNYHQIYTCQICHNHFVAETERDSHEKVCKNIKEPHFLAPPDIEVKKDMKVCEMCSLFFKYNTRMKYVFTGVYSKPGVRIPCEYCGKLFFEVKLFKMIPKPSQCQKQYKFNNNNRSNEERLKNIKKRLIQLNKLSRF